MEIPMYMVVAGLVKVVLPHCQFLLVELVEEEVEPVLTLITQQRELLVQAVAAAADKILDVLVVQV
jgi:hypothetical protein